MYSKSRKFRKRKMNRNRLKIWLKNMVDLKVGIAISSLSSTDFESRSFANQLQLPRSFLYAAAIWFFTFHIQNMWPHLDSPLLSSLIPSCKYYSLPGAGYDTVSLPYLTCHNAWYASNPTCATQRTADSTVSLIMIAMRGSWIQHERIKEGGWVDRGCPALDARGRILGIVGMGKIGKAGECYSLGMSAVLKLNGPKSEKTSTSLLNPITCDAF